MLRYSRRFAEEESTLFAVAASSENARNQIDNGGNDGLSTCSFAKPDREGIPQLG